MVVTSPTGAAIRDILQVTSRRWRCAQILIAPARVQGVGADREVVAALQLANQVALADVIIVARGGGSLEDLWTFNEESVVRAIVASRLPVVSAVGHEIDVTLADLAADKRATPSEAGEFCVPDLARSPSTSTASPTGYGWPALGQLRDARERLHRLADARAALEHDLVARRKRAARLAASLEALSPLAVLARGYSLTFLADAKTLVRNSRDVNSGDLFSRGFAAGQDRQSRRLNALLNWPTPGFRRLDLFSIRSVVLSSPSRRYPAMISIIVQPYQQL